MPRGSDAVAAGEEFKARTGMTPNAETMILANQARQSRELRAASIRPIDHEATKEMDEGEAQGFLEEDFQAVEWRVRGPFVVVVAEDPDGHLQKFAFTRKGQEKHAERAMRGGPRARDREEQEEERQQVKQEGPSTRRATTASASGAQPPNQQKS